MSIFDIPKNFYPTPPVLIDRMLSGVDFLQIGSVLEPSAGKGDITKAIQGRMNHERGRWGDKEKYNIDCVEIDDNLRHILKGNDFRVVGDDFIKFYTSKRYDLIIANPPFEDGDRHITT